MNQFMSLEQAMTLLDREIAQGKYALPSNSTLTSRERSLRDAGQSIPAALSKEQLNTLAMANIRKQKYRGLCHQIPIKIIEPKLSMVCLLQNLHITKKYTGITRFT